MSSDWADTVAADGMEAWFKALARVMATPAPMPVLVPRVAEPSAMARASVLAELFKVSAPPALTEIDPTSEACDAVAACSTATAAATMTAPLEVEADGVAVGPDPAPLLDVAVVSAKARWVLTWPFTPPLGAAVEFLSGAPAVDAVPSLSVEDEPVAVNVTAPATVNDRAVEAVTEWLAKVSANAAPVAALEPLVSPVALVITDAV